MKRSIFVLMGILVMLAALFGVARQTEAGLTGGPAIIPAPPSVIDDPPGATNTAQQAFNERQGVVLPAPLEVDPGGAFIPAGTVVDSHMIFLNTIGNVFATDQNVVWTFDGPIVGVMSNGNGSLEVASSGLLGAVGTTYPPATFGARGLESNDSYLVGPANTITVSMLVTEPGDWIRVVTLAEGIGEIKPGTPFTPDPTGNGRAVAFDGLTTLYYTITGTPNIYKVSTLGFGSLGPIPLAGRSFLCGSLSWDSGLGELWCGSYDGSSDVYTVNPGTGVATLQFNANAVIPGGIAQDSCYGAGVEDFIDGLALDSNGSVWLSGDAARTIYHIDPGTPALLGSFTAPDHPNSGVTGCNTGIEVAPGGFLELAMQTGPDQGPHDIVKIVKRDDVNNPPIIVSFTALGTNDPCIEDIAYDAKTFAPRCAFWSNEFGASNVLTAWDVQCTRTIGYWKNHADDAVQFLPISLGDDDTDGVCVDVTTAAQVETITKAHKGQDAGPKLYAQLLAAKLNVAMGDLPPADFAAIAPVIDAADALLGKSGCNPDTGKKGADRAEAQTLLGQLDTFNNKYSP